MQILEKLPNWNCAGGGEQEYKAGESVAGLCLPASIFGR